MNNINIKWDGHFPICPSCCEWYTPVDNSGGANRSEPRIHKSYFMVPTIRANFVTGPFYVDWKCTNCSHEVKAL